MSGKFGADYDKTFVLRLRAAHGQVFQLLAKARAQTENTVMRSFIESGMKFVNTHISLLESTGLVPRRALH
jgi:putative membrane protein